MVILTTILSITSVLIATTVALPTNNNPLPLLATRGDVSCMDNLPEGTLANVNEAVECINYLASLGDTPCTGSVSATSFCRRGNTQITGIAKTGNLESTSSCANVARAAGLIMDRCSRGDGTVRGQVEAWGNGELLVDIRLAPQ